MYDKKVVPLKRPNYLQQIPCIKNIIIIQLLIIKNSALLTGLLLFSKHSLHCKRKRGADALF
nr:MAG TPA: hypothetical protein [Caudoviricetes sp.]